MRQDGFYALRERTGDILDSFFGPGNSTLYYEITTKSGRRFKYNLSDYRFGADFTENNARGLANEIAAEKYRETDWDRDHPRVLAEMEIADALYALIMDAVARMREDESN